MIIIMELVLMPRRITNLSMIVYKQQDLFDNFSDLLSKVKGKVEN